MDKLAMRRLWFQLHKWIGLVLVALLVPIALSGAVLVWSEALHRIVDPARYATSGTATLPLARYLQASRPYVGGGKRVANIVMPAGQGPITVTLVPGPGQRGGEERRMPRTMLYLDPPTARVLDAADSGGGVVAVLHRLHGSFLLPGVGRWIVGWVGVATMLSCLTGLWLWWPVAGHWSRGWRWRRQPHVAANLHHAVGFWIAVPLFVLSLTGAWISFPRFFGALAGEAPPARVQGMATVADPPLARPALGIDDVVARGAPFGPDAPLRTILLPTQHHADWTLAYDTQPLVTVAVADDSGVAARSATFDGGRSSVAQWMRRLHDGTGMGLGWQILIFVGGVLPLVLAVTGAIMWWRARRWRSALAIRRSDSVQAGPPSS